MMELKFIGNELLYKALVLYNSFGPPDSIYNAFRKNPELLGEGFLNALELDNEVQKLKGNYGTLFCHILGIKKSEECKMIVSRLRKSVHLLELSEDYTAAAKKAIISEYGSMAEDISKSIIDAFGEPIPKTVYVCLLRKAYIRGGGGSNIYSTKDSTYISVDVPSKRFERDDAKAIMGIIIHEVLHGIVNNHDKGKLLKKDWRDEALVNYFAPDGMLTARLGLSKLIKPPEIHKNVVARNRYFKDASEMLLPVMNRYARSRGRKIWEFL